MVELGRGQIRIDGDGPCPAAHDGEIADQPLVPGLHAQENAIARLHSQTAETAGKPLDRPGPLPARDGTMPVVGRNEEAGISPRRAGDLNGEPGSVVTSRGINLLPVGSSNRIQKPRKALKRRALRALRSNNQEWIRRLRRIDDNPGAITPLLVQTLNDAVAARVDAPVAAAEPT